MARDLPGLRGVDRDQRATLVAGPRRATASPWGDHGTPTATPPRIGPYQVVGRLGEGGFGEIFEAIAPGGELVAVKRMRRELALRAEAILRFEREVEVIRRIGHHNVVAILDVGDDGAPYFAMELLRGIDLWRHVREVGRLTPAEALAVLGPLARALDAAHAKGVVHRDLKASNVFLDRRRVVLLDFGVAKLLDDGGPRLTRSRIQIGTPSCMAPEQILGLAVGPRTDVYGLGVLAHHMMAGRPPFNHAQPTVVRQMHLAEAAPPVSRRAPVGVEIDRVVARAMSKDPAARQPGASAFVRELEAAARGPRAAHREQPVRSLAVHVDTASGDQLPAIVSDLVTAGMAVAFEADNAATLLAPLEDEPGAARRQRRRLIERAANAVRTTGAACFVGVGGAASLLRLGAWIPARPLAGLLAMNEALEGITAQVEAVPGQRLVRLVNLVDQLDRPA